MWIVHSSYTDLAVTWNCVWCWFMCIKCSNVSEAWLFPHTVCINHPTVLQCFKYRNNCCTWCTHITALCSEWTTTQTLFSQWWMGKRLRNGQSVKIRCKCIFNLRLSEKMIFNCNNIHTNVSNFIAIHFPPVLSFSLCPILCSCVNSASSLKSVFFSPRPNILYIPCVIYILGQRAWGLKQTEIEEGSGRAKWTPHVQPHAGMQGGV